MKKWTDPKKSFCQLEVNSGQNNKKINENGPKIRPINEKLRQNDGFLCLVAAEGERGDPPRSTILEAETKKMAEVDRMRKCSTVLTSREPELGIQKICLKNEIVTPILDNFGRIRPKFNLRGDGGHQPVTAVVKYQLTVII